MSASLALLDYATAQSFGLRCVASLWTPSVSCAPSRYALRLKIVTDVSLFACLVLPIVLVVVETVMTI